jgi:DNA-binding MarR family transcriptional regulator
VKEQFLNFLEELMKANPDITEKYMTDDIQSYIDTLRDAKKDKPILSENGKTILKYLQENKDIRTWKAKDVAEGIGISSRGVSGAFRKLVNDGFCEKLGQNPVIYCLTEKGTNYIIEDEQGE